MTSRSLRLGGALLSVLGALGSIACAPTTPYRTASMVPPARPLAWDGRAGEQGSVRVEATFAHSEIAPHVAEVNGPALRVPSTTFEASASIAPVNHFEIAVRGAIGSSALAQDAQYGVPPIPGSPSLTGIGAELRLTVPIGRIFALGFAGNFMHYSVPFARWIRTDDPRAPGGPSSSCTPSSTCWQSAEGPFYALDTLDRTSQLALDFALMPTISVGPSALYGWVVGYAGFHSAFTNDGFSANPTSPLKDAGMIAVAGVGYAAKIDVVRVSGMTYFPFTTSSSPVQYGPGLMFTVGLDLHAFGERPAAKPTPPPAPPPATIAPPPPPAPPPPTPTLTEVPSQEAQH